MTSTLVLFGGALTQRDRLYLPDGDLISFRVGFFFLSLA